MYNSYKSYDYITHRDLKDNVVNILLYTYRFT